MLGDRLSKYLAPAAILEKIHTSVVVSEQL